MFLGPPACTGGICGEDRSRQTTLTKHVGLRAHPPKHQPQAWTSDRPRQPRPRPLAHPTHNQPPPRTPGTPRPPTRSGRHNQQDQQDPRRPTRPGTQNTPPKDQDPHRHQERHKPGTTTNPTNHQPQPPTRPTDKPKNHPLVTAGATVGAGRELQSPRGFASSPAVLRSSG